MIATLAAQPAGRHTTLTSHHTTTRRTQTFFIKLVLKINNFMDLLISLYL